MDTRWFRAGVVVLLATAVACQEGETVTAPGLTATCEARPASGPAPLVVAFLLDVSGAVGSFGVSVSYGDGASGTSPDAPHTYATAGTFTAVFTVTTATQSARCSTAVTVQPGPAPSPTPGANQAPRAVFKSTPDPVSGAIAGTAPLSVRFNMCASTDPEGDRLYFLMDFDGDGRFDRGGSTGAQCRSDYTYPAGTWRPRNCVRDVDPDGVALHEDQCRTYTVVASP